MANRDAYNAYRKAAMEQNPFMIYRLEPDGTWYQMVHASDWEERISRLKEQYGEDQIFRVKDRRKNRKIIFEG